MPQICEFIDDTEEISPIRKAFYKQILQQRNLHLIQEPAQKLEQSKKKSLDALIAEVEQSCPQTDFSRKKNKEIEL